MDYCNVIPANHDDRVELGRKCLQLISDIAARGAQSRNPEQIGYALQELTQVLFERSGSQQRRFEPVPVGAITDLHSLHEELAFVAASSDDMAHTWGMSSRADEPGERAGAL